RAWTIGCATGEEAYTLAILFFEHASKMEIRPKIQVFASDLDENSIMLAREGLYPAAIEADVSPERLERFFIREGDHYRVTRELRDSVLFTNHNVLRDPPFSRQDIISCRNLLIYLQRPLQDTVFNIFHYALKPGGYLFLGSSESAEGLHELFEIIDKSYRLYRARPWKAERLHLPSMPLAIRKTDKSGLYASGLPFAVARYLDEPFALDEKHRKALEAFGPPSILIDENYGILHISETAGRYLFQPKGPVTSDLLKLVRPELQLELRTALFQAFEKSKATFSRPVPVQFNGHPQRVVISVRPRVEVSDHGGASVKQALVVFLEDELDEQSEHTDTTEMTENDGTNSNKLVTQLEEEVMRLR